MRILKRRQTLLAASALCALLPLLAYARGRPEAHTGEATRVRPETL